MASIKEELRALKHEVERRIERIEEVAFANASERERETRTKETGTTKTTGREKEIIDKDGDDPRDTPPPTIFGEEIDTGCQKFGLLVGINAYQPPVNRLNGCVNDVTQMMQKLVSEFDFPPSNIHMVTDANATKARILAELRWLVGQLSANRGSAGIFHFSGHGTQTLDRPPIDETDFLDEAIVPVDHRNLIRDDEVAAILQGVSPSDTNLAVVFDSCHSGTGIRNPVITGRTIGLDEDERALADFLVAISALLAAASGLQYTPSVRGGAPPIAGGHTLLAASAADETALDTGRNGLFTRELLPNMRKDITYEQAFNPTRTAVQQIARRLVRNHQQTPQIENGNRGMLSCFLGPV